MNLGDLNSDLPKPWLNIKCNDLQSVTLEADTVVIQDLEVQDLSTNVLTLVNQASVPNPAVGAMALFTSDPGGVLSSTDPLGTTVQYATVPPVGAYVVGSSPSVVGNLPSYSNLTGDGVSDSGIASSNVFLADGSVSMTGNLDVDSHEVLNVLAIRTPNTGVIFGSLASAGGNSTTAIGNDANGSASLGGTCVGRLSTCSANNCCAYGISSTASAVGATSIGRNSQAIASNSISLGASSNSSGADSIAIGSTAIASAQNSISLGNAANNVDVGTCLIGHNTISNIRPNNDNVCDLGTSSNQFKNLNYAGWLNGGVRPAYVSMYSTYDDTTVNNTVIETNISNTGMSVGSLTVAANQPLGSSLVFNLCMNVSSVAGDTLDIRWYTNAGLLFTNNLVIPALAVNLPVLIQTYVTIRNGALHVCSNSTISGLVSTIIDSSIVYDRTIANAWTVTAQWGANVNQLTCGSVNLNSGFSVMA